MTTYIIRRLLLMIPTFVAATLLFFVILEIMPNGPVEVYLQNELSKMQMSGEDTSLGFDSGGSPAALMTNDDVVQRLKEYFGLDKPFLIRYLNWLGIWPKEYNQKLIKFNPGESARKFRLGYKDSINVEILSNDVRLSKMNENISDWNWKYQFPKNINEVDRFIDNDDKSYLQNNNFNIQAGGKNISAISTKDVVIDENWIDNNLISLLYQPKKNTTPSIEKIMITNDEGEFELTSDDFELIIDKNSNKLSNKLPLPFSADEYLKILQEQDLDLTNNKIYVGEDALIDWEDFESNKIKHLVNSTIQYPDIIYFGGNAYDYRQQLNEFYDNSITIKSAREKESLFSEDEFISIRLKKIIPNKLNEIQFILNNADIEQTYPDVKIYNSKFKGLMTGDLGKSYKYKTSVWSMISDRLPISVYYGFVSFLISHLICIPLGIMKAIKHGSKFDFLSSVIVFIGYSVPGFLLGAILLILLGGGSYIDLFPLGEFRSDHWEYLTFWQKINDQLHHSTLPMIAYMVGSFATLTVMMKNSLLENLSQDYVRTAFAKGLSEKRVIFMHAVRNSLIPIATGIGHLIGIWLAGSYIIERIFNIDGIGMLGFKAMIDRDYPIVLGFMAIGLVLKLLGNLISDICYAFIDPRIRFK